MEIRRHGEDGRPWKDRFSWKTGASWDLWNDSNCSGSANYTGRDCVLPIQIHEQIPKGTLIFFFNFKVTNFFILIFYSNLAKNLSSLYIASVEG